MLWQANGLTKTCSYSRSVSTAGVEVSYISRDLKQFLMTIWGTYLIKKKQSCKRSKRAPPRSKISSHKPDLFEILSFVDTLFSLRCQRNWVKLCVQFLLHAIKASLCKMLNIIILHQNNQNWIFMYLVIY